MTYYRFKTFVTSYFFPKITNDTRFMFFLYGNYGGFLASLYWMMFCHCSLFRKLHKVDSKSIDSFDTISSLLGKDSIFAINYGTPNQEQKKSIIGLNMSSREKFFAKYATKEAAKQLCRNEASIYQLLAGTGLVPRLYDYHDTNDYVLIKCEFIEGIHLKGNVEVSSLLPILHELNKYHYPNPDTDSSKYGLKTSFAHGDFCQWNMIKKRSGEISLIDWELSQERPLGFDLFTFIFLNTFGQDHSVKVEQVLDDNIQIIELFFRHYNISDWIPYLYAFIKIKTDWLVKNNDHYYCSKLSVLLNYCESLFAKQ